MAPATPSLDDDRSFLSVTPAMTPLRALRSFDVFVAVLFSVAVSALPWSGIQLFMTGSGMWDREVYARQILG